MAEHKRGTLLVVGSLVPGYRGVQASSGLDSYEIYQIHSKTHANYQLYQPTPTQRDGLGWGLVRKDEVSWGTVDLFLHAEPRRRLVAASCCMEFWMAALVAAMGRLGPCV